MRLQYPLRYFVEREKNIRKAHKSTGSFTQALGNSDLRLTILHDPRRELTIHNSIVA